MNKQTSRAALCAGVLLLASSGIVSAHSRAQFTTAGARCNACHTGGPAPTASFTPGANAARSGAGFRVSAGQRATLMLDVAAQPGTGLGLAPSPRVKD